MGGKTVQTQFYFSTLLSYQVPNTQSPTLYDIGLVEMEQHMTKHTKTNPNPNTNPYELYLFVPKWSPTDRG